MQYKLYKKIKLVKLISILLVALLVFSGLQIKEVKINAESSFNNVATLESDIKGVFQSNFNSMNSTFSISISGNNCLKYFFETNSSGDIITSPEIIVDLQKAYNPWFNEQLHDMKAGNYNAYSRLALDKHGISISVSYLGDVVKSVTFTTTLIWRDGANPIQARNTVKSHVNNFLNSSPYTSESTDDAKLKAINKYICETFQYDYRLFVPAEEDDVNYSAFNMLSDSGAIGGYKRGVCQAYAMYGYMMLKEAGYEAITITGEAGNPRGPHAWNMVKVNGKWYHIDFTWNDPITSNNPSPYVRRQSGEGSVGVNYFMRSDSEIGINHFWNSVDTGYTYPKALAEWTGTPPIEDITQPMPSPTTAPTPTSKPTASPTLIPTSNPNLTKTPTTSSDPVSDGSSCSDVSCESDAVSSALVSRESQIDVKNEILVESEIVSISLAEEDPMEETPTTVYISGQLLDGDGNPLSGVTVNLFATNKSVMTDENGMYEFANIKIGSYKIWLEDFYGEQIGELPIVISFGDKTTQSEDSVQVKGGILVMDLTFDKGVLSISSVSSPKPSINSVKFILITVGILALIGVALFFVLRKEDEYEIED